MSEIVIIWTVPILQVVIASGLINVWIFRFGRATKYRGAGAHTMKEEFSVYGLPSWFMYVVGFLKIVIAIILFLALFIQQLMPLLGVPALMLLSVLMLGAITMHIKIKDPLVKILPAIGMLTMALVILYIVHVVI
ncbi:MAG: DoxX family protein [Minisyncoccia bacterium]